MFPVSDSVDNLSDPPKTKNGDAGNRNSDSDFDIFGPSTTTEKMVKFCPKPRVKSNNPLAKTSKPSASEVPFSAATFPNVANTSYPGDISVSINPGYSRSSLASPSHVLDVEEGAEYSILNHPSQSERGVLYQGAECMESLDDNSQSASKSVVERSSFEFHASSKSTGIPDVPVKSIDDGINAPLPRTDTPNSEETLNFSGVGESLYEANDVYEQINGKFQPMPCSKSKKHTLASSCAIETSSGHSTRALEVKSLQRLNLGSSTVVNSASKACNSEVHDFSESASSLDSASLDKNEGTSHNDCRKFGQVEALEVVASLRKVDAGIQQTSITVASGPALNISTNSSQTMEVSSELEIAQNSFLVTKEFKQNVDASQVTEVDLNLQVDSSKLQKKESTVSSVMESPDDVFLQSDTSSSTVKQKGKFQPKRSLLIKEGKKSKSVSFVLPNTGESTAPTKCQSELSICNPTKNHPSFLEMVNDQFVDDSLSSLANCDRPCKVDHGGSAWEDAKESSDLDTLSQPILNSDLHLDKFQSMLRATTEDAETSAGISPGAEEFGSSRLDSLRMETNAANSASIGAGPSESTSSLLDSLPTGSHSMDAHDPAFVSGVLFESSTMQMHNSGSFDMIDEMTCVGNANNLGSHTLTDNVHLHVMLVEQERQIFEEQVQLPYREESCALHEEKDEARKSPMKRFKRINKMKSNIVDSIVSDDEGDENATISGMDEDNGDDDYDNEDRPKKRQRASKKSNGVFFEHEKETKTRKKVSEKSTSTDKALQKKRLPHGSRRKSSSRQVNKALLEVSFDELDRSQLILRDLIRIADSKERTSNKIAAVFKSSLPNQSSNFFAKNDLNKGNYSGEEQRQDPNGEDENEIINYEAPKLNYHTYMNRPQRTRWSKTDTELFYQAVRQFGADFAMIQVLFPTRSREQVKAKFKNEQRKHPMQIADALVYRGKDHSHFEKVIQHLQAQAEIKAKLAENRNQMTNLPDETDNNEEENLELNKTEQEMNDFVGGQKLRHPMTNSSADFNSPNKLTVSAGFFDKGAEDFLGTEKLMVLDL